MHKRHKLLIWNINQRANYGNKSFYPDSALDVFEEETDIIVFTEFYKIKNWESLLDFQEYKIVTSNNGPKQNDIMIAFRKEKYELLEPVYTWPSNYANDYPNYLEIELRDTTYGNIFYVIGTRILVAKYDYNNPVRINNEMLARQRQGERLSNRIKELYKNDTNRILIGGGDLNVGRRGNPNTYWSIPVFSKLLPENMQVIMPDGVSHQAYKGEYAGCPDLLFFSKNIKMNYEPYNWDFTDKDKAIYPQGKDTENIPSPYPDHAKIKADFQL